MSGRRYRALLRILLGGFVFLSSLLLGVVAHLDLPVARDATADLAVAWFNQFFRGTAELKEVERLTARGLTLRGLSFRSPDGRTVLSVDTVDADFKLGAVLVRVLRGYDKLSIVVDELRVSRPNVQLYRARHVSATGQESYSLSIADAFTPISSAPAAPGESSKPVRVWFPLVKLREIHADGEATPGHVVHAQIPELQSSLLVSDRGVYMDIERFDVSAEGFNGIESTMVGDIKIRVPGTISGEVRGQLGSIPLHQRFALTGDTLSIEGEIPEISPELARALLPEWPLDGTLEVRNKIHGTLPRLQARIDVRVPSGTLQAEGLVTVAPELEADLDVDAHALNLAELRHDLPSTSLNLRSSLEVWFTQSRANLELNATLLESTLEDQALPIVDVRANYDERGLLANATLHERGLPMHVEAQGKLPDDLDFDLSLRRTELRGAPRIYELLGASGIIEGSVQGHLGQEAVDAHINLETSQLSLYGVTSANAKLSGDVVAPLSSVATTRADLELRADGLKAGSFGLRQLSLTTTGLLLAPYLRLSAESEQSTVLELEARADLKNGSVDELQGSLRGLDRPVSLRLEHAHARGGELEIRGLHVAGEGTADLDFLQRGGDGQVAFQVHQLNLGRVARAAGFEKTSLGGTLDGKGEFTIGTKSSGGFSLNAREASWGEYQDIALDLAGQFDGQRVRGELSGSIKDGLDVVAKLDATVPESLLAYERYDDAFGELVITYSEVNLDWLLEQFAPELQQRYAVGGQGSGSFLLRRKGPDDAPELEAQASTSDLELTLGKPTETSADAPPLVLSGLNVDARGALRPRDDRAELAVRVSDSRGDLITATGSTSLPLTAWQTTLPSTNEVAAELEQAPLDAVVLLNRRSIDELPGPLQLQDLNGELAARIVVSGSTREPQLDVALTCHELSGPLLGLSAPVDAQSSFLVRPRAGRLSGSVALDQEKLRIGTLSFDTFIPALAGKPRKDQAPLWTGEAQAFFEGAPLELLGVLAEQRVRGRVQGSVAIRRLTNTPEVSADLRLRRLEVAERPLGMGTVTISTAGKRLVANARFDDEYGSLDLDAAITLRPTPLLAEPDYTQPLKLSLKADDYDAAVLAPFTAGYVQDLSGSLQGGLSLKFSPSDEGGNSWSTTFDGHLTVKDGRATPTFMGLRLENIELALIAAREGEFNVVRLEGFRARARSSVTNLRGEGKAYFRNLTLERATFDLLPERFPALNEGNKIADLSGKATGLLTVSGEQTILALNLSGLSVDLASDQDNSLIDSSDNQSIEVVEQASERDPRGTEVDAQKPVSLRLNLGSGVRVKNRMLSVVVRGEPEVTLQKETEISGDITLVKGGRVQVLGKIFVIEYGRVMFNPNDSMNPHLDLSASWRASSGVTVHANISGTVSDPILEWSSEPPLPGGESAVLALVIGSGTGNQDGIPVALLAAPLNQALGETGMRGVEFYAGSESDVSEGQVARLSDRSWNRYTASVQLTDEIWFEGSYRQETSGPDSTPKSGMSGTLDWRFAPNWSARTEVGTLGFGLDLQWQYRY